MSMKEVTTLLEAGRITSGYAELQTDILPGWMRVRLGVAGVCGTDMHYFKHFGNAGFPLERPVTLGHEACGYVVDPNGQDFNVGDLVALNPIIECGACEFCRDGQENLCTSKRFPGSALTKPHIDGFFQEVFDFPASSCHSVAQGVSARHAAFAEPLACSLHAVEKAEVRVGDDVLVIGCGPMGLLSVVAALSRGANVTVVDLRRKPVEKALEIGASRGLVLSEGETVPTNEFHAVIEASGAIQGLNAGFDAVKKGGVVSILSNLQMGSAEPELHKIMLKEIKMVGAFQFNVEFEGALAIIESGRFDFDAIVSAQFPLADVSEAFDFVQSGQSVGKVQLVPSIG